MNVLWTKIVSMSVLASVSLIVGFIPMLLVKKVDLSENSRGGFIVSCLSCFGGGVILTTALTHMLPEVNLLLKNNIEQGQLKYTDWPLAEILVLCGFFMIYIIEEVTHALVKKFSPGISPPCACRPDGCEDGSLLKKQGDEERQMFKKTGDSKQKPTKVVSQAALRGFLVVLAISLHAVFEGIAMGLTDNTRSVWLLFLAISAHKYVIAFCISLQFAASGLPALLSIIYFSTFALISPIGAGIGILISETVKSEADTQTVAVTVLQGLATGTLLYVVFFEVIEKERFKGTSGLVQVSCSVLGFLCMLGLESVGHLTGISCHHQDQEVLEVLEVQEVLDFS